jgi:hypothetical protein
MRMSRKRGIAGREKRGSLFIHQLYKTQMMLDKGQGFQKQIIFRARKD